MLSNCIKYVCKTNCTPKKTLGCISKSSYTTEATFETQPYKLHKLDVPPSATVKLTHADAIKFYTQLHLIRRMETACAELYKQKIIRGFLHLYAGQEAIAVGINCLLRPSDSIITSYRTHGWALLMGITPLGVFAELCGKKSGCSRGKAGSMHMYAENFYGGQGIVGAQVPLGAGIALAAQYKGTGGICITSYGDGAANQGQVFEAFNIAKLWNLPCIFVCENNHFAMGTAPSRSSANLVFYTKGDYIPGIWVDGMDVLAVRECFKFAIDYSSSGKGPLVIEACTYRYSGHSMSDPGTSYRTRQQIQEVRKTRDPIASFREKLIAAKLVTEEELTTINKANQKIIDEAVEQAIADVEVEKDELTGDIYALNLEGPIRNINSYTPMPHKRIGLAVNI